MEDYMQGWDKVEHGQNWKNKKTGRVVIVLNAPKFKHGAVELLHPNGRRTLKYIHYFMADYEMINIG